MENGETNLDVRFQDERLKNPDLPFDYFEELERRVQDIRTSENGFIERLRTFML